MSKDLFSNHANDYARFRPSYPESLFEFIVDHNLTRDRVWDCGTGNGQVAQHLALYYNRVDATDISEQQLRNAFKKENIFYQLSRAEASPFDSDCFDLIAVGQAVHWFDIQKFYHEVRRVGKEDAVLALIGYSPVRVNEEIDKILDTFYFDVIYPYWEAERRMVDNQYRDLPFPFEEIDVPYFQTELTWSLSDMEGYVNTWSSVKKFISQNERNPVDDLIKQIKPLWRESKQSVYFPVFLRLGRIKK